MTAAEQAHTRLSLERDLSAWKSVFLSGLLFGGVAFYVTLTGIVGTFEERNLIQDVITVGEAVLLLTFVIGGYVGARKAPPGLANMVIGSGIVGLMSGTALALLVLIGPAIELRQYLPNASGPLYDLLTNDMREEGFWFPMLVGWGLGILGGLVALMPRRVRNLFVLGLGALVIMGLFAGLLRSPMLNSPLADLARELFASNGLTITGAIVVLAIVGIVYLIHVLFDPAKRYRELPESTKQDPKLVIPMSLILLLIVVLIPLGLGPFIASAVALMAVYILMGLGLNITLGLAGLLDLGFVAFFAVGAYTVGLLTSTGEYGLFGWPYVFAIPFAIIAAMLFGLVLGLPILGIRGDYLAIATLGFGEIIAILTRSELLKDFIGGPRGILAIPRPFEAPGWLNDFVAEVPLFAPIVDRQTQIYYVALACAAVIAFVAYRLRDSRLGRAWVAIREDEDVAEALGVNLVQTKSLAYVLGAAFAGLGGAVFASLFGSIISSSIRLDISILIVSIVIIGGMGSIPGVVLGAIVLVGLPELFREFSEYRFLLYGIALILVMRWRPEGLIPSKVGRQEMHHEEGPPTEGDTPARPSDEPEPRSAGAGAGSA
jgi:branched-chain amino acid transport system permease protein